MNENLPVAATPKDRQVSYRGFIEKPEFMQQIKAALPRHMTPERFIRSAATAALKFPKIADCTTASVALCLLTLAQSGLPPDGRVAHLIPRRNKKAGTTECTVVIDYKGYCEMAHNSGRIDSLTASVICDGDVFEHNMGEVTLHTFTLNQPRGNPIGVWAKAWLKGATRPTWVIMGWNEVMDIRDKSQGWIAFKEGIAFQSPWQDSEGEMAKKTALRRLFKVIPISPEISAAMEAEDQHDPLVNVTGTADEPRRIGRTRPSAPNPALEAPSDEPAPQEAGPDDHEAETPDQPPTPAARPEPSNPTLPDRRASFLNLLTSNSITEAQFLLTASQHEDWPLPAGVGIEGFGETEIAWCAAKWKRTILPALRAVGGKDGV